MSENVAVTAHRDGTVIDVQAQPRAARTEIVGIHNGALRVRISAPPVDGAANEAVIALLSRCLGIRKSDVSIVSGSTGRRKRVLVRGVSPDEVCSRLKAG